MKSLIKDISTVKKEIEMEIPAVDAEQEYNDVLKKYGDKVKIKGFRQGKVPPEMVKQMYHEDIRESVINNLVPRALNEELRSYQFKTAGMPVVTELKYEEGEPIQLKAEIELWPEIKLPDYKKIKLKKNKVIIGSKEIDDALEDVRLRSARYEPAKDRGVADGDYVVTEIKGQDVNTKRFLPTDKAVVLANHPDNEKALNENLMGLKAGESAEFSVEYIKDHANKKLAGKNIRYKITVLSLKEKKLPELNDDFAKELGDYEDLNALTKRIKDELKESKEQEIKRQHAEDVVSKIADKVKVDLPESIIDQEATAILRRRFASQPDAPVNKEDMDKLMEEAKEKARRNLKNHLILTKIAETENFSISEKDYQEEMQKIAAANRVPVSQVSEQISRDGSKEDIKDNLLLRRTIDFLVSEAIIN
ncbi:MAG: trigger factor [Acidobacteria bacterium]|nr:trigger factor [Acidobacteriota bacterium]